MISFIYLDISSFFRALWNHHLACDYNEPFYLIIAIIIFNFFLERTMSILNARHYGRKLPPEVDDVYEKEEYLKSQKYKKTNERFSLLTSTVSFIFILFILIFHVFGYFDQLARSVTTNPILVALMFFGLIMLASDIINTPFALYDTFVIEERFGFNTTTMRTFWFDKLRNWILVALIGGGVTALVIWIYYIFRDHNRFDQFWLWAWAAVTLVVVLMNIFYSNLIVPLFNKQTPLEEGKLRDAINDFCKKVGFTIDNVYVIDGSRRSTKANAYFTGLGSRKRIVLYDTLIEELSIKEVVAVLAHEIGHYKKKHTLLNIPLGIIQTGITLYIFSLFTLNPMLSWALGAKVHSIHMVILAFGIIYSPVSTVVGLALNKLSRNHEFQADRYVKDHYEARYLITGLKKLSSKSLSNLTPHPAYVFFNYSHPTLLQRIRALKKENSE